MRKPSAALVVATAALVMSTIGTSLAATHYVISSPKQVKPGSITLVGAHQGGAQGAARSSAARAGRPAPRAQRARSAPPAPPASRRPSCGRRSEPTRASTPRAPGVTARARRVARHVRGQLRTGHHALRRDGDAGIDPAVRDAGLGHGGPPRRRARVPLQARARSSPPGFPTVSTVLVETTNGPRRRRAAPSAFTIAVLLLTDARGP